MSSFVRENGKIRSHGAKKEVITWKGEAKRDTLTSASLQPRCFLVKKKGNKTGQTL